MSVELAGRLPGLPSVQAQQSDHLVGLQIKWVELALRVAQVARGLNVCHLALDCA